MNDVELDALLVETLVEARAELEAEVVEARRLVSPDFAAMVTAAHERDPEAVSADALAEAESFAPILKLDRTSPHDRPTEAELDELIAEARTEVEADAAARSLAGVPALPGTKLQGRRRWLGPALVLAAVVAGLAFLGLRLSNSMTLGERGSGTGVHEAEYLDNERPQTSNGVRRNALPSEDPARSGSVEEVADPEAEDAIDEPEIDSEATSPAPSTPKQARPRAKLGDRAEALDAEAQARWAAGDLDGAESSFREILAIAGRSRYADLAYGDLFTLARQRGDAEQELALWSDYLARFPSGRFAQDARAGLCRRSATGERAGCWQSYLEDYPEGVHRRAAERALGLEQ